MTKSTTTTTTNEQRATILCWAFFGIITACCVGSIGTEPNGPDTNEYRHSFTLDGTKWVHHGNYVCSKPINSDEWRCGPAYNGGTVEGMPKIRLAGGNRTLQL